MLHPELCGRDGVEHSVICDVNDLLGKEDKDVIEGLVNGVDPEIAAYGVAVVQKMKVGMFSTIDDSAKNYATTLHDSWGVGDKSLQNGIVIFISIEDRVTFISRGQGLHSKLTDGNLDAVIGHMRKYLRQEQYGKAIESAVRETSLLASGAPLSIPSSDEHHTTQIVFFLVLFGAIVGYAFWTEHTETEKLSSYRKGQAALARLTREVRNLEDEKYTSTSCPICLEDFESTGGSDGSDPVLHSSAEEGEHQPALPKRRPVSLQCGHILCHSCCEEYFKGPDCSKCPICRAPTDPNGGSTSPRTQAGSSDSSHWTYSRCNHHYHFNSNADVLYRINRMRFLYPNVMTPQLQYSMTSSVQSGSQREFLAFAAQRETEVGTAISSIVQRRAAAAAGNKGSSRSSFGGGRSSGGRGGRW